MNSCSIPIFFRQDSHLFTFAFHLMVVSVCLSVCRFLYFVLNFRVQGYFSVCYMAVLLLLLLLFFALFHFVCRLRCKAKLITAISYTLCAMDAINLLIFGTRRFAFLYSVFFFFLAFFLLYVFWFVLYSRSSFASICLFGFSVGLFDFILLCIQIHLFIHVFLLSLCLFSSLNSRIVRWMLAGWLAGGEVQIRCGAFVSPGQTATVTINEKNEQQS